MKSYEVYELATNKLVGYVELKHLNVSILRIAKATKKHIFYIVQIYYLYKKLSYFKQQILPVQILLLNSVMHGKTFKQTRMEFNNKFFMFKYL